MKKYKSVQQTFSDCPFKVMLPKITIVEPFINIEFSVSFIGKSQPVKYMVKECTVTDKLGNVSTVNPKGQSNFLGDTKTTVVIEERRLLKSSFTLVITILTMDGDSVDVTYFCERNKQSILKSIAISDMTEQEKDLFMSEFNAAVEQMEAMGNEASAKKEKEQNDRGKER